MSIFDRAELTLLHPRSSSTIDALGGQRSQRFSAGGELNGAQHGPCSASSFESNPFDGDLAFIFRRLVFG